MPITLKESDFSKAGWQARRPEQLKGSDMGKTLDAFKPYYKLGGKATFQQGKANLANAAVTALTKAIGAAKAHAFRTSQAGTIRRALTVEGGRAAVTDNYLKIRLASEHPRNVWVDAVVDG